MFGINLIFLLLILVSSALGLYLLGLDVYASFGIALFITLFAYMASSYISRQKTRNVLALSISLGAALLIANLLAFSLSRIFPSRYEFFVYLISNLVVIYIFIAFSYSKRHELRYVKLLNFLRGTDEVSGVPKLVDTSALIDGRIVKLAESGILEGELLIPKFVLGELQHIADSTDPLRREKGRRGLEMLRKLQELNNRRIRVTVISDNPRNREVDHKLINIARSRRIPIITTDYNLQKLAEVQGVEVINLNQLSRALAPTVFPGDTFSIKIVRPGKEAEQGLGYLEDGTMVVVDKARRDIGKTVNVEVVSIYQSDTGRIVFARKTDENGSREEVA